MPRRAARIDKNHKQIVQALRKAGASVWNTHMVGHGFPDIVVGFRGKTYLIEIKDGSKPPSKRKLTEEEQFFFDVWVGHVEVVESVDQALHIIGVFHANKLHPGKTKT